MPNRPLLKSPESQRRISPVPPPTGWPTRSTQPTVTRLTSRKITRMLLGRTNCHYGYGLHRPARFVASSRSLASAPHEVTAVLFGCLSALHGPNACGHSLRQQARQILEQFFSLAGVNIAPIKGHLHDHPIFDGTAIDDVYRVAFSGTKRRYLAATGPSEKFSICNQMCH